jgi:lysophospholipase L1-like esterase
MTTRVPGGVARLVDGKLIGVDGGVALDVKKAQALASGSATARITASQRVLGRPGVTGGGITTHQLLRAPAHFDAVQFVVRGANFSATNAMKMSVCSPAQRGNGYAPLDGSGASMALTPVTWGSADRHNFRNPGGGAATTFFNNGSGTVAGADLIENDVASDWIPLFSSDRTDTPGAPPLLMFRMYGLNPAGAGWNEMSDVSPNAWKNLDPDFYSGYWGTDQTSVSNPGGAPIQGWCPSVEVRYLLRGKRARTLAGAGDSVMQGWIPANSVPQFGANINGYVRRLVAKLNATGMLWSHVDLAYTGDKSRLFHERAMNAILGGHITDLIVKPWSVNEFGDGVGSVRPAIRRTEQLIEAGRRNGVNVIVEYLWGGNGLDASAPINALLAPWLEDLKASGVPVADIRSVMNKPGVQPQGLKDEYKTVNSGGVLVDATHLSDAGQEAAANALFAARAELGLG